jgi:hypothetical protein
MMRELTSLLLLVAFLVCTMGGCGPGPSSIATPEAAISPSVVPTPTLAPSTATPVPEGKTIVVTSGADSVPGTLRHALLDAEAGDTIIFDPTVFAPSTPVTIYLTA